MRDSALARKNVSRISCWGRFAMGRSVGHGLGWLEFFEEVPEPRQKAKVLYPLPELLLCCLVGVLCGAEGWVEVEEYGEAKLDFLRRFLPFDHGIPSHDTFSDVFNALDPEGFKAAFIAWTAALQENIREIVAVKPAIVTIDAIGCQKKIATAIRQRGADYLLALKENQPTLHRDVVDFLVEQR